MRMPVFALVFALGCGSEDAAPPPATTADVATDASLDLGVDAGPAVPEEPAGPIRVGAATVRMPVPVGIGTAGFGQVGGNGPKSRFAKGYPATRGIYTHPTFRAVAIEGALGRRLVLLRCDLVGITQQARTALVARIQAKGGPNLDQELVISATHTHSGPGRLIQNELWSALADEFFPAFFDRAIDAMADAVLAALADLEPATFGYAIASSDDLHGDRRCENPELKDGRMPVLRFDRMDGTTKAIVIMYAVHGTVIGKDTHLLSRDFHGGMELKIAEQFDHPVTVVFFNSWSGDMSPKTGDVADAHGVNGDFNGIEAAGNRAAEIVLESMKGMEMHAEVPLRSELARIALNHTALGYVEGEFDFEWGAVYCGGGAPGACWGEGDPPNPHGLTTGCIPFPETSPAPQSTIVGMFRVGDLRIVTLPGEPVTQLGLDVLAGVKEKTGYGDVMLLGYANDYIGYSLSEEDWYRGGYEASGSLWGPKQGPYLSSHAIDFAEHFAKGTALPWPEGDVVPGPVYDPPDFPVEPPSGPAQVTSQPPPSVTAGDVVTISFDGGDPWLLAPELTLQELQTDGTFSPVARKDGSTVGSDGYEVELALEVTPKYEDDMGPVARTFSWTAHFPTMRGAPSTTKALAGGVYRLRIGGLTAKDAPYELTTEPFQVK